MIDENWLAPHWFINLEYGIVGLGTKFRVQPGFHGSDWHGFHQPKDKGRLGLREWSGRFAGRQKCMF